MPELEIAPKDEIDRVSAADLPQDEKLALLADLCRLNALVSVKRAGSGHLGSSFSAMDVVAFLLFEELNTRELGWGHPDRDVYFSSKGHDVPGLYAVLYALGVVPKERLLRLRRLGGLDGHPDVGVPGIEANSGSLGMGISKGRGIAWAKRHLGRGGRVVVMTGDGELQEGQNYEGLQGAAHEGLANLTVVVDRNVLQSDKPTEEIVPLGDLEAQFRAFGWHVRDVRRPRLRGGPGVRSTRSARSTTGRKRSSRRRSRARASRSWSIRPRSRREAARTAGTPARRATTPSSARSRRSRRASASGSRELGSTRSRSSRSTPMGGRPREPRGEPESGAGTCEKVTDEYVVEAYGDELVELGGRRDDVVVLDADLASDCRVRAFELAYPDRFVECGIAEQDMVSTAAGIARQGLLPVVNSFASFLAARANEQIYNQASEGTKVVYALHYAGLIPAGPGKSHQSIRDISLLGSAPEREHRPAGERGGDAGAPALGGRGRGRERRDPARDRAVAAADRARGRARARARRLLRGGRGRRARRVRAGDAARGADGLGAPRREGNGRWRS